MDFLRDGGNSADADEVIHVLGENWDAVRVFRRCRPRWITGFHAPVYDGIEATEIRAATSLLGIRRTDIPDLLDRVDVLIRTTREARSEAA
ncbi:MAG: hypothetical protein ACREPD_16225 [Stenotrophomonas sp.]|uniref:hypothetical protein n=1 Tax=Stenotrophomonas sp. TaxID=69392 RepID=UPI003D6CBB3F